MRIWITAPFQDFYLEELKKITRFAMKIGLIPELSVRVRDWRIF